MGTRSWIRVGWDTVPGAKEYRLYWSAKGKKPGKPDTIINAGSNRFYIQNVQPEAVYKVWVAPVTERKIKGVLAGIVRTQKKWIQDPEELKELKINPSSAAVPKGMKLFWQDEFNDALLNRNKWTTNYFSTLNYLSPQSRKEMLKDQLPQPAYRMNGKTIDLFVNDSLPVRLYDPKGSQKISSIQTYDWRTNENLLDNSRGGYFEVKVRRSSKGNPKGLNTAFWLDSPGPDLRYYLEQGTVLNGVHGIRPPGQVFEIDVFENLNAQFVLHGQVDKNGKFIHNLATHIANGYQHKDNWVTHGILWTPVSIKHYINGTLIHEYTDKHKIYSPNHFMNVFLGSYGSGNAVNMEVDYIRYYQWPLKDSNELPNPGFEDSESLVPWEGTGTLTTGTGRNSNRAVLLDPGQMIEQYVYVDRQSDYKMEYWFSGARITATIEDVAPVNGALTPLAVHNENGEGSFKKRIIRFKTGSDFRNNKKTIRISFANHGASAVVLDDITIKK
ncbi:glycoside hydrolase family 16 protein [Niabella ginsenosidivorans]|nr:glycoside hydrolase family 16 protein [Niabella ginsenosidivorans]